MYPITRLLGTLIKARSKPKLAFTGTGEISFRCRPWDLDMFMEMNNGRVLTLYDLGRFDLSLRVGLAALLKDKRWGLVVASSTVRYRQRIRIFDKVTLRTQLAGVDERWVYISQSMWVGGRPASSVLLRTGITSAGKVIPSQTLLDAMGADGGDFTPQAWEQQWIDAENARPWPPQP